MSDRGKKLRIQNASCLVHINRKRTMKSGIFQVGMDQLEFFYEKILKRYTLQGIRGVADSLYRLKIPNTSCLVHMNRKRTMK